MNSLDKDMMYYFYDEMEKQAILNATAKGIWGILKASGNAAKGGAQAFGKAMSKASTMGNQTRTKILKDGTEKIITNKDPLSMRHMLGATALGVGTIYAGKKGLESYSQTRQLQKAMPKPQRAGQVNLNF